MKKSAILLITLLIMNTCAFADILPDKIYAAAHYEINKNTKKISPEITLYSYGDYLLNNELSISDGEKITLKLDEYVSPKRGKRNGYYKVTYIAPVPEGETYKSFNLKGTLRPSNPKDIKEIAKSAGISAAGYVLKVPGFTQALAAAKGLITPNENESRLKSAGENVYKSTPLTYAEKGEDFKLEPDDLAVIKLKTEE